MGECWSGLNPNVTYDDDGPSIKCRGRGLRPCGLDPMPCVGLARVNYVYKIGEQPIPSPEIEGACLGRKPRFSRPFVFALERTGLESSNFCFYCDYLTTTTTTTTTTMAIA